MRGIAPDVVVVGLVEEEVLMETLGATWKIGGGGGMVKGTVLRPREPRAVNPEE